MPMRSLQLGGRRTRALTSRNFRPRRLLAGYLASDERSLSVTYSRCRFEVMNSLPPIRPGLNPVRRIGTDISRKAEIIPFAPAQLE